MEKISKESLPENLVDNGQISWAGDEQIAQGAAAQSEEAGLAPKNYFIGYLPVHVTAAVTQMPQASSHFLDASLIKIQCVCLQAKWTTRLKCLVKANG